MPAAVFRQFRIKTQGKTSINFTFVAGLPRLAEGASSVAGSNGYRWAMRTGVRTASALMPLLVAGAAATTTTPFMLGGDRSARIEWLQVFASPNDDWVNDIVLLRNGRALALGFLNRDDSGESPNDWRAFVAELTPGGHLAAQNSYGEQGGIDAFWSAVEAADGRRIFAGFTTRIGGGGINSFVLLTEANGALVKEAAFGGAGNDRFTDVAEAKDGYVFLGHSQAEGEAVKRRVFLVKTDKHGNPLWERIHDAPDSWGALYIEPAPGGGFIIAGGTSHAGDSDMFAMKVDEQGRELWRHAAGTPGWDEINHGLVVRPDGSIVLVGYAHRRDEEANDLVTATLSASGEVRFIQTFGGPADDRAILAKADDTGRIWMVGQTASAGAGGTDLLLARLDEHGGFEPAILTVGGPADDNGTALLPLNDGSLLLSGYSRGLGRGGQDAFVIRLGRTAFNRPHPAFKVELIQP